MTSLRLKLYELGAKVMIRPMFRYSRDPRKDAARLDWLAVRVGRYRPLTLCLDRPLGGRPGHWIQGQVADCSRIILYFHGGGYFAGSGRTHGPMLSRLAALAGVPVYAQDYRLTPEAPFPAGADDALAAWDDLMARGFSPDRIILSGDSAGGGLMFGLLSVLCRRGTPPAAAFAMSPWTDLTMSGGTVRSNAASDATLPADRLAEAAAAYLAGAPPTDPRASPLFADFPAPPPILIQVGSPEVLEDDTYRLADRLRAAGADVLVQTWSGAPHVWHLGEAWVPEARAALGAIADFVQTSFAAASR